MKRQYNKPVSQIVEIITQNQLATESLNMKFDKNGESGSVVTNDNAVFSRSMLWIDSDNTESKEEE